MTTNETQAVIKVQNISKTFHVKSQDVQVLSNISLTVNKGDFLILFGHSGCGKSTLLHILLGLEPPSTGKLIFFGKSLYENMDEDERTEFRKTHIGMVYQQPNWIKSLSVLDNIVFALRLNGIKANEAVQKANSVLRTVGMEEWSDYVPTELSSGQQQKIALARAIVTNPDILIADEPTGNLDFESGQDLMNLLSKLNKEGKTIIMVTHDLEYLPFANRAIQMFNGKVIQEVEDPKTFVKTENKLLKRVTS